MCYSAQIRADYTKLVREYGAMMSLDEFAQLYAHDAGKQRPKTPKAMDDGFAGARTAQGQDIVAKIQQWHAEEMQALDAEIRVQGERRDAAHASLAARPTQKARNEARIAGNRVERAQARLDDLRRTGLLPRDSRIFPGVYAPVIVSERGQRVIKPMRYQCRLPDTPARHDTLYPGTYNARRDSLGRYWKPAFGHCHGVVVVQSFYEHVPRHALEQRTLSPARRPATWCWNSARSHRATCSSPACGRSGKDRRGGCCPLRPSPTNRRAISPRPAMTAASSRSGRTTWMPG